jgi:hypothetical protein
VAFLFLAWQVEQVRRSSVKSVERIWASTNTVYEYMKEQLSSIFKDTTAAIPPPSPQEALPYPPQHSRSPSPLKTKRYSESKPTEVSHENLPAQQLAKPTQQPPAEPGPQPTWPNGSSATAMDLSAENAKFSPKIEEKGTTSDSDTGAPEHHQGTTGAVVFGWVKRLTGFRSRRKPGDNEA